MGIKFANNVSTTLSAGITASDTSIPVTSITGMPSLSTGDYFYATLSDATESTWEVVKVTSVGASLTAVRGQDGTTAAVWASGSTLSIRPCAAAMNALMEGNSAITKSVTQTSHGFTVLAPVFYNITNSAWEKAKADSADTLATHVVVSVADANTFTVGQVGSFTIAAHGLDLGYWFTSDTTAGELTQDDLSYSNPVLFAQDADTIVLLGYRPSSSNWDSFMFPGEVSVTGAITLGVGSIGKLHVCSGTAADYAVILPTPVGHRGELIAFDMDAALTKVVTLDAGSGDTVDGERYRFMWSREKCVLRSSGYEWKKIAGVTIPMVCSLKMLANQYFASNTWTLVALDTSKSLNAPAAMQDIANRRIVALRPGLWNIAAHAQFHYANTAACTRGLLLIADGAYVANSYLSSPTGYYGPVQVECLGCAMSLGGSAYIRAKYSTGDSNPTLVGETSNVYPSVVLMVEEVPTW